ncbi:hypothetical protein [Motilimonas sp. E26]|uniref:STAS domain-containing protein n=1 Tax=Motilimonas sp. E26 TaxID=2865674 RepID=UPI001E52A4CD|nr:hypothetical protein [Motilimonas sp. E26]MCE0555773.1 hypothetical protein [Motilimonas sp. E26]
MLDFTLNQQTLSITGALVTEQVAGLAPSVTADFEKIDLSGVCDFDSAGLAWLVTFYAPLGCEFINLPSSLRKLADLYGLTPLFEPA